MSDIFTNASTNESYVKAITFIAPAICSLVCILFMLFLIHNCKNIVDRRLRILSSIFFLMIAVWWISLFVYTYSEDTFPDAGIVLGLAYVFIPILFYHVIYYPTHVGGKRFSPLNYLLPIPVLSLILIVVSLLTYAEDAAPSGVYEIRRYASMFVSGPLRLIPAMVYCIPTGLLLMRYSRQMAARSAKKAVKVQNIKSSQIIVTFISLGCVTIIMGVVLSLVEWNLLLYSICAVVMSAQQIVLTYYTLRKQSLAGMFFEYNPAEGKQGDKSRKAGKENKKETHIVSEWVSTIVEMPQNRELSRMTLENYFHVKHPYTNPEFKMTDLAEVMGVNRSEISSFINRTYDMNFKRYVNRWRIEEFERLMALPSNERKNPYKILPLAGFSDSRHYQRALQLENELENAQEKKKRDTKPIIPEKTI